jgi:hypothetical protein
MTEKPKDEQEYIEATKSERWPYFIELAHYYKN